MKNSIFVTCTHECILLTNLIHLVLDAVCMNTCWWNLKERGKSIWSIQTTQSLITFIFLCVNTVLMVDAFDIYIKTDRYGYNLVMCSLLICTPYNLVGFFHVAELIIDWVVHAHFRLIFFFKSKQDYDCWNIIMVVY